MVEQEIQMLAAVSAEVKELRHLMDVTYKFLVTKDLETVNVRVMRTQIDLRPALAR